MSNENYETTIVTLSNLLRDINSALGDEQPENWTRDSIIYQIEELKKGQIKGNAMKEQIQRFMDSNSFNDFDFNGSTYRLKRVDSAQIVVKVHKNLYESEFMNGDICKVLGQVEDGKLLLERLKDEHVGLVNSADVSYPKWEAYPFK